MARMARVVAAGVPHHVTQRGNRRQQVFFSDADYQSYMQLLAASCREAQVAVWAYCLMPNHVHLVLVPRDEDGLRAALADAHRRYSREINFREGWRGYLWQGRFASFPMDDNYLLTCARYAELNPVRARLVGRAREWRWSSARAHLKGQDDALVQVSPLLKRVIELAGSRSTIEHVPYEKAYGQQFDDMRRRVPKLDKIRRVIGFKPTKNLDQIIQSVIDEQRKASSS